MIPIICFLLSIYLVWNGFPVESPSDFISIMGGVVAILFGIASLGMSVEPRRSNYPRQTPPGHRNRRKV